MKNLIFVLLLISPAYVSPYSFYPFEAGDTINWTVTNVYMNQKANSSFWQLQKYRINESITATFIKGVEENSTERWRDKVKVLVGEEQVTVYSMGASMAYTLSYLDCYNSTCSYHDVGIELPLIEPISYIMDNGTKVSIEAFYREIGYEVENLGSDVKITKIFSSWNITKVLDTTRGVVKQFSGYFIFESEYEESPVFGIAYSQDVENTAQNNEQQSQVQSIPLSLLSGLFVVPFVIYRSNSLRKRGRAWKK